VKTLLLIIAVILYTQPSLSGYCDMGPDPGSTQHISHELNSDTSPTHNCCDNEAGEDPAPCNKMMQCGTCPTSVFSLPVVTAIVPAHAGMFTRIPDTAPLASSHQLPLYRPPIS
jgi:hypothetical protein